MSFNEKFPMQNLEVMITIKKDGDVYTQRIAGGIPSKSSPSWIQLDGNTDYELLSKMFINLTAVYALALEGTNNDTMWDTFREKVKTVKDFLNKLLKNLS